MRKRKRILGSLCLIELIGDVNLITMLYAELDAEPTLVANLTTTAQQ